MSTEAAVCFAYAAGGLPQTAPEGQVPLDSLSPLRRGMGAANIVSAQCPARQKDGGRGGYGPAAAVGSPVPPAGENGIPKGRAPLAPSRAGTARRAGGKGSTYHKQTQGLPCTCKPCGAALSGAVGNLRVSEWIHG